MENLPNALLLMFMGISVVFIFLTLLVIAVTALSKVVARYFPEPVQPAVALTNQENSAMVAAVAAVHAHRRKYNKIIN